jgi:hypothetical protein
MLPIDPGDGPGSATPAQPLNDPSSPGSGTGLAAHGGVSRPDTISPAADREPRSGLTRVPIQATPHGGTIIRPGAVAWGGLRNVRRQVSGEALDRALAAAAVSPAELPALLTELAAARLWVPLPTEPRPFTDGTAVRLPLVSREGTDFVPCFTSVLRLTAWADQGNVPAQRAGDPRTVPPAAAPHIVVPAAGLAGRLPPGVGLALNPDGAPGLPLYPECVPCLAELAVNGRADPQVVEAWVACNAKRLYTRD